MKPKGKLPKWAIPVGIVTAVAVVFLLRKKSAGTNATEPGTQGLSNQSFIPVTGENVAGVGAPAGGGGGSTGEGLNTITTLFAEQQKATQEYMKEQNQQNVENRRSEHEWLAELFKNLGTGGGAPSNGNVPAPFNPSPAPPSPSPGPVPPPAPPPAGRTASCPPGYSYNPADGPVGPHSCYKYSRDRCPNPQYPYKHVYQDGHVICSNK